MQKRKHSKCCHSAESNTGSVMDPCKRFIFSFKQLNCVAEINFKSCIYNGSNEEA
jgi:hypothetical protein